jgi:hypothetical protein
MIALRLTNEVQVPANKPRATCRTDWPWPAGPVCWRPGACSVPRPSTAPLPLPGRAAAAYRRTSAAATDSDSISKPLSIWNSDTMVKACRSACSLAGILHV